MDGHSHKTIDRRALDPLPHDVEPVARWVEWEADLVTGDASDWTDDEREQLKFGCRVLTEISAGELVDAQATLEIIGAIVTGDPRDVLERQLMPRARTVDDVQRAKADFEPRIRQVLRGYLRDVLDTATRLGVSANELAALLGDVVEVPADHAADDGTVANVVSLGTARSRRSRGISDETPGAPE